MSQEAAAPRDPRVNMAHERTGLARFRTQLALDRTTLAWVRTTLTMASFGFALVGFFRSLRGQAPTAENIRLHEGAIRFGVGLIVLGTGAMALAAFSHWLTVRRLRRGEPLELTKWPLAIVLGLLLTIMCIAGLWSLSAR
jgi:putative membrane protein